MTKEIYTQTLRQWLHDIEKFVPDEQLNMQTMGFVIILPLLSGPVTLSNFLPDLSRELIESTGAVEQDRVEYHSGTEH